MYDLRGIIKIKINHKTIYSKDMHESTNKDVFLYKHGIKSVVIEKTTLNNKSREGE